MISSFVYFSIQFKPTNNFQCKKIHFKICNLFFIYFLIRIVVILNYLRVINLNMHYNLFTLYIIFNLNGTYLIYFFNHKQGFGFFQIFK